MNVAGSSSFGSVASTLLIDLLRDDKEFEAVEDELQSTIREHRDNGQSGGIFTSYNVIRVSNPSFINLGKVWQFSSSLLTREFLVSNLK